MADNVVTINMSVEGNAAVQFKIIGKAAEEAAEKTKKSFLDAGRIFDNFIANLGSNAVNSAIGAIKSAFSSFNGVLSDSIKASSEQEDAVNSLNAALVSSGQYTRSASKELQEYAGSLQLSSKYSDDAILSATSLISSLSKLDKDGLKKATLAALDLSAAFNIDLETAARVVGKAAEGQVEALKKYGIEVQATGNKARDSARALEAINSTFGGRAAAQVDTYSGSLAVLKNRYGEVLEQLGETITKNPAVIEGFKQIGEVLGTLENYISKNKSEIKTLVSEGLIFLIESFNVVIRTISDVAIAFVKFELTIAKTKGFLVGANTEMVNFSKVAAESKQQISELEAQLSSLENNQSLNALNAAVIQVNNSIRDKMAVAEKSDELDKKHSADRTARANDELITQVAFYEMAQINQDMAQSNALASYANFLIEKNAELYKKNTEAAQKEISDNNARIKLILGSNQLGADKALAINKKLADEEKRINDERTSAGIKSLDALATFTTAKTKELQIVGKSAAIASTTISTYKAAGEAQAALSGIPVVGPALGFAAAAAITAAGLLRVAQITGVPLKTGITEVPPGFQNDSFPARLQSGERVVSAPQNRDLTEFLAGSSGLTSRLDQLISALANGNRTVVNIGGKEIIGAIQDELDSGRSLIV